MPIYEYECSRGHRYEVWESVAAPIWQWCEQCPQSFAVKINDGRWHEIEPGPQIAYRVPSVCNANVGAVIKPGDIHYTPRMGDYIGRRRWQEKNEREQSERKAASNPTISYRTGPEHFRQGGESDENNERD